MPRSSKIVSIVIVTLLLIIMGGVSKPAAPVAAIEPQTPTSPGTWSQAFAGPNKLNPGYMPGRPIEWNGTLYAAILGTNGFGPGVGYWSGEQWLQLNGLTGLTDAVVVHQNRLYAAGDFMIDGIHFNLAYWDGNLWTAIPTQFDTAIFVLASYNNQLYVGGYDFSMVGQPASLLYRWDGTTWHAAAEGIDGVIFSMLARPDGLYLGGAFNLNGQGTGLIRWNGSQWQNVGGGVYGHVFDLKWANEQLYISGQFTSTLVPTMKNVAAWNGTSWNTFGTGIVSPTHNLALLDGDLYALSQSYSGNSTRFHLHRWDSNQWLDLATIGSKQLNGSWLHNPDAVLVAYQQELLAFGLVSFTAGSEQSFSWGDSALRWKGDHWEAMTPNGITASDLALVAEGEDVYAASSRLFWGNGMASLAHLNANSQWQSLIHDGLQDPISYPQAIQKYQQNIFAVSQSRLYQAGATAWTQIGTNVSSLAQANNLLYVAGDFEQFNGVTAHNLITWNGTQWQALDTPAAFNNVTIVEAHGENVYISDGKQLARWDGSQWTTLATNVVNIGEVEPTADGVYIAGTFSSVGGVNAAKIAYWNGSAWSSLPGMVDGSIADLEMGADGLYVAGNTLGIVNTIHSPGIVRWDGTAWHGVGGGVQDNDIIWPSQRVLQLAATPTRMVMYGYFNKVGNRYESSMIAAWEYGDEPLIKAENDYVSTYRSHPVRANVLSNDWSYDITQLELVSIEAPSHGTAVIEGMQVVYKPHAQFQGTDTLTYTMRDVAHAITATAQLQVTVWNHFPTLVDQEREALPFTENLFDPLTGVLDYNGDSLIITQASAVSGTVTIVNNNQLRYLPPNQEQFTDVLTYTVSDGYGGQQTVLINLRSFNGAIMTNADYATTYRPHSVTVDVLANDWSLYNEPLQLIQARSEFGTATIVDNQVHYQPTTYFQDTAILEYTVLNPTRGVTATGTLKVKVQNHVPTVAPLTITVQPNSTTLVDVLSHAIDLNGDPLNIYYSDATLGTATIINNQIRYTTPNYYPFTDTITYTMMDDHNSSVLGTVIVSSGTYNRLFLPYTSK